MGNDLSNPNVMPRSIKKYGGFTNDELKDLRLKNLIILLLLFI